MANTLREDAAGTGAKPLKDEKKVDNAKINNKSNDSPIRVMVACHFPLLRDGISKILDGADIKVVAKIENLLDLVHMCEEREFDVLLLDVDLKGLNLTKILRLINKNEGAKLILIVDEHYDEESLISAIRSGVRGYLLKEADSSQLVKSVKIVHGGELWVERKMMTKVVNNNVHRTSKKGNRSKDKSKGGLYELTETEAKIVKLVLNGYTNKEVADDLYLSVKTVKFHLYKVYKKLSVKNRSELILFGFRNGIIS